MAMKYVFNTLATIVLAAHAVVASASVSKLYVNDFAMVKGDTRTVTIYLDNSDYQPSSVQFDVYFSSGIQPVESSSGNIFKTTSRVPSSTATTGSWIDSDKDGTNDFYRLLLYNASGTKVTGTSGALLTFKVTTTEAFGSTDDPATIMFKKIRQDNLDDLTSTVYTIDNSTTNVYLAQPLSDVVVSSNESKVRYVSEPLKVVATCTDPQGATRAFASNGEQWVQLYYPNGTENLTEGATYDGCCLGGTVTTGANPMITITDEWNLPVVNSELNVYPTAYADIDEAMTFTPNEVVYLTGHYFVNNGQPSIARWSGVYGDRGTVVAINSDWCSSVNLTQQQYTLKVVVQALESTKQSAPSLRVVDNTAQYAGYMMYLLAGERTAIPTGIEDIVAAAGVTSVKYYNLAGVESSTPHTGMNIVVTTHTDGTRTSTCELH